MSTTQWDRQTLVQYSMDMRQFADFRQSTLANGMRLVEAYNSSGLNFTVLPDRGLDIWAASYNGKPLTWVSQNSPFPPDFGQPWLRQFNGGMLVTCGLQHVGGPEEDDHTGESRDLHGRYSRLRAGAVNVKGYWADDQRYLIELSSTITQSALFGEQYRVERVYRMELGQPTIEIEDTVANIGDMPAPLMLLYHINLGYPLVREGTKLAVASSVVPRTPEARAGMGTWPTYDAPTRGYPEQVFFHSVKADNGKAKAALINDDFGLAFEWDTDQLPYLTQWKNTRQGIYVCGVEPGTCIPEGLNAARKNKRVIIMQQGETRKFAVKLTVLDGAEAMQAFQAAIEKDGKSGTAPANCQLDDLA